MKALLLRFALVFFVMAPGAGLTSEEAVKKYKGFTPEQVRAMPDAQRSAEMPMMYIFAARKALAPDGIAAITMDLNALMYPAVSDYTAAVKMFQADVGDSQTGVLTVSQIHAMTVRADYQKLAKVGFPTPFQSYLLDDTAYVAGTLKIIDERIAWPVNYAIMWCYKGEKYCERYSTTLSMPDEKSWAQMYYLQELSRDLYKITRWDNEIIEAVPYTVSSCRTTSLSLNFKSKEFFEFTRNAGGECEAMGVKLPQLEKPRISQIVDGKDIIEQEFEAVQKTAFGYLSSAFRKDVEKLTRQTASPPRSP